MSCHFVCLYSMNVNNNFMPFSIILCFLSIQKLERNGEHVDGNVQETGSISVKSTATLKRSEETSDREESTERDLNPPAKRRKTSNYTFVSITL